MSRQRPLSRLGRLMSGLMGDRMSGRTQGRERGSAPLEMPMVLGLILVPFGMLILSIPTWVERQAAARDAAGELARAAVAADPAFDPLVLVGQIEQAHGLPAGSLSGSIAVGDAAGDEAVATVSVIVPALSLPVFGDVGAVTWTAEHAERRPDFGADR